MHGDHEVHTAMDGLELQSMPLDQLHVWGAQDWSEFNHGDWIRGSPGTPLPNCDAHCTFDELRAAALKNEDDAATVILAGSAMNFGDELSVFGASSWCATQLFPGFSQRVPES